MKKLVLAALVLATLVAPAAASAHPLGNFTVNRYSRVELSGDQVYVLYVLDMAEIPTFQERQGIADEDAYARTQAQRIGTGLRLTVGGRPVQLEPLRHALAFPPGVAGLRTMRFQAVYASDPLGNEGEVARLVYRDTNFANRIGWKEIVVRAAGGSRIVSSSVPAESVSRETLAYPKDLLSSPLDVTQARAAFVPGTAGGAPPMLLSSGELGAPVSVRATSDGGFAALIAEDDLTAGFVLVSLVVAMFWGAAHAFSPGHGKAIVAGYLIGTRGTPRHAVLLGLIVTATHTIGVFALGLVTLALSEFIVPEQLYPWLNLVAALLVVGVGLAILRVRLRGLQKPHQHHHHGNGHRHHDHAHEEETPGARGILGIGVSAGIIPCPTALVVLLAAISLHRVGFGLVLIVAFSVGLAAAVTSIGLVAVLAKRTFSRVSFDGRLIRALPAVSAIAVLGVGLAMTVRALPPLV